LKGDPALVSFAIKALGDVNSVMQGNKTIKQLLGNVGALEIVNI